MKRLLLLVIVSGLILVGCTKNSPTQEDSASNETDSTFQTMSEEMPNDFGFSVSFGFGKKNEINTFKDTVTKDLIEDRTVTTDVALTDEEMIEIYGRMKAVNIKAVKKLVPDPIDGSICAIEPYEKDEWESRSTVTP